MKNTHCNACEEDGEILPGSVHMIGAINCRMKPAIPTTDSKNIPYGQPEHKGDTIGGLKKLHEAMKEDSKNSSEKCEIDYCQVCNIQYCVHHCPGNHMHYD